MPLRHKPPRHLALALFLAATCLAAPAYAEKLEITSTPPGATVEINGVPIGTTPLEKEYPGGYFHRTRTSIGSRLEHALVARVNLDGYATREIQLTEGPMNWMSLNGRNHGEYWLLKAKTFHVDLDPIAQTFTGDITAKLGGQGTVDLSPELSLEEIMKRAKPAVVFLKGYEKAGTGFFVTETGVIVTNAHVARNEGTLLTMLADGQKLQSKVVYIDGELDVALLKVEGEHFPHLPLADATTLQQGENVLAVGNPSDAMAFSVTKGIVSAVGKFPNAGPGTWVQTDAPINSGNSGGPLLNTRGEVIGINTLKLVKKNTTGIGFALSSTDVLDVLHRFYPKTSPEMEKLSSTATNEAGETSAPQVPAFGTVVFNQPQGAEIYVDGGFVGNVPSTLQLSTGNHRLVILSKDNEKSWVKILHVEKDSKVTITPTFGPT